MITMAITPAEANKPLPKQRQEAQELERIIDEHLQRTYPDAFGGRRYPIPTGTTQGVIYDIMALYRAAGWTVHLDFGDQRDPDNALYFKPRKGYRRKDA